MKKKVEKQEDLFLIEPEEVRKILLTYLKTHKIKKIKAIQKQIKNLPPALSKELCQLSERQKTLENYPWEREFQRVGFFFEVGKFGFFLGRVHKKLLILRDSQLSVQENSKK